MKEPARVVVKIGGSLYDLPDLKNRLEALLQTLGSAIVWLVPGGGELAERVRELDRIHGLGEVRAHELALRAVTLNAWFLRALLPLAEITSALPWERAPVGSYWLLDGFAFWERDRHLPGTLPANWNATSDSLAARVALVSGATRLILLKSISFPEPIDWIAVERHGGIDPLFLSFVRQNPSLEVEWINLRSELAGAPGPDDAPAPH